MNCWVCGSSLIWGGDQDAETDSGDHLIETNLSCNECGAFVLVYHGQQTDDE